MVPLTALLLQKMARYVINSEERGLILSLEVIDLTKLTVILNNGDIKERGPKSGQKMNPRKKMHRRQICWNNFHIR